MFCPSCGVESKESDRFCAACGKPVPPSQPQQQVLTPAPPPIAVKAESETGSNPNQVIVAVAVIAAIVILLAIFANNSGSTTNADAAKSPSRPVKIDPPTVDVTVSAYAIVKNPFQYKNKIVALDPTRKPVLYNGELIQYSSSSSPFSALRFNRMIDEKTGLYDIMALDATGSLGDELAGQLVVFLPAGTAELQMDRLWDIEPLGSFDGTNAFGGSITVPAVKFWRYSDQRSR